MLSVFYNRTIFGYLLCILCFGAVVFSFYPGLMSPDSVSSLASGREGTYIDINSPLFAFVWGKLDALIPGAALMFIFQNAIFWSGCAILFATAKRKSFTLGICLILLAILPQILSQLTTVWKDTAMGASLLMATALIYRSKVVKSKVLWLVSALFLFFGYAMRVNALPAILPLAIWSGYVAVQLFEVGQNRRLLAPFCGFGYFLVLSLAVYLTIYSLTGWKTVYPFHQIYLYDLAALSTVKNEALFPPFILEYKHFSLEGVKARYTDFSNNFLMFPNLPHEGDKPVLRFAENAEEVTVLRQKWYETIMANPMLYLQHRWNVFSRLIGVQRSITIPYWEKGIGQISPEFEVHENTGFQLLMNYFQVFRRPFPQTLFRAAFWLVLCVFFIYHAIKRKFRDDWDLVLALAFSCLLYTFAFFPTTPSTEFRYLFWPAIASALATSFGIYLLFAERSAKRLKNAHN